MHFPHLFSELSLGRTKVKNRSFSAGHATRLVEPDGTVGERLLAYHQARAEAEIGMIVTEVNVVHPTYEPQNRLSVTSDSCIPGLRRLAEMGRPYDCRMVGQLFHPGRVAGVSVDGSIMQTFAPSEMPDEVYKNIPKPLSNAQIWEIIDSYSKGGRRMAEAGLDGIEIISSMGYLPSQFLNPRLNQRDDEFGGGLEGRLKFLREIIAGIRKDAGDDILLGIRISSDEMDDEGMRPGETIEALRILEQDGQLDYFNIIAATTATYDGWMHIIPHMVHEPGYLAPLAKDVKEAVALPVFIAGRVNQPQEAERLLASGQADMIGMVRAHICDPHFTLKAKEGRVDDIRACIGCNQACIGHGLKGHSISCIQFPETGRELSYYAKPKVDQAKRVIVVGGGPGGMKAAAVAAERGHAVTLFEKDARLGGQALLAQLLPDRSEFGGIVTNLAREMEIHGVDVQLNSEVTAEQISDFAADAVIVATGARPQIPQLEGLDESAHVLDSWAVIRGEANVGKSVVIWDWRSDWVGLGIAQMLAENGCHVRLAVNGIVPGERIPSMVRDHAVGELHKLGVEITPYVRLFGADADSVYFQHVTSKMPVIMENVDTLVSHHAPRRMAELEDALHGLGIEAVAIGDCVNPRTAEEAVLEGLRAGMAI
jgi:2,4-dienoyl-CoA reductase-like NADH-dependent reductase (Old Yellow Enzyme family)